MCEGGVKNLQTVSVSKQTKLYTLQVSHRLLLLLSFVLHCIISSILNNNCDAASPACMYISFPKQPSRHIKTKFSSRVFSHRFWSLPASSRAPFLSRSPPLLGRGHNNNKHAVWRDRFQVKRRGDGVITSRHPIMAIQMRKGVAPNRGRWNRCT